MTWGDATRARARWTSRRTRVGARGMGARRRVLRERDAGADDARGRAIQRSEISRDVDAMRVAIETMRAS